MHVPPSHPSDLSALITQLADSDPVVRESAAARLAVIGNRAISAVQSLLRDPDASPSAHIAALRTLDALDRLEAIDAAATAAVGTDVALALDGIELLDDALSDATDPERADRALEHLTRLTLDATLPERRRLMMMEALSRLPVPLKKPIFTALATDTSPAIAARASDQDVGPHGALEHWSTDARLPSTPDVLIAALAAAGELTPITALRHLVDLVREREKISGGAERDGWRVARGLLHEAIATRGSVIALYDLRETLEQDKQPVSAHFLTAAMAIADASCLDAIAARWVHAGDDVWLRDRLERIFHAIIGRARLRRSAPVMVRLLRRHPSAGPLIATAPRTRPPAS
jgi:hypothetical protein